MGLTIIVDGYNYIGRRRGLQGDMRRHRDRLVSMLSRYRSVKGYRVTVVFDGGQSGWSDEHGEIDQGVHVVYSRHGETADDVIIRMAYELGNACVVVTSDREVARKVRNAGGVSIGISEFEMKLQTARTVDFMVDSDESEPGYRSQKRRKGNPRRLSREDRRKQSRLKKL